MAILLLGVIVGLGLGVVISALRRTPVVALTSASRQRRAPATSPLRSAIGAS